MKTTETTERRQHLLDAARRQGYPQVALSDGFTIEASAEQWRTFCETAADEAIATAVKALQRVILRRLRPI
ncbi:MAG: hypothetical protein ACK47B_21700 [Armatimonadota bacterium]